MTLAALASPEVMSYTTIAGMAVITGLYTILLPLIAFAVLGASRHLAVGADSTVTTNPPTGSRSTSVTWRPSRHRNRSHRWQ